MVQEKEYGYGLDPDSKDGIVGAALEAVAGVMERYAGEATAICLCSESPTPSDGRGSGQLSAHV